MVHLSMKGIGFGWGEEEICGEIDWDGEVDGEICGEDEVVGEDKVWGKMGVCDGCWSWGVKLLWWGVSWRGSMSWKVFVCGGNNFSFSWASGLLLKGKWDS